MREAGLPASEPPGLLGAARWWRAFVELSSGRPYDQGLPGPVPWWSVDAYARRHGYVGEDFEDLLDYVTDLDRLWLRDWQERAEERAHQLAQASAP